MSTQRQIRRILSRITCRHLIAACVRVSLQTMCEPEREHCAASPCQTIEERMFGDIRRDMESHAVTGCGSMAGGFTIDIRCRSPGIRAPRDRCLARQVKQSSILLFDNYAIAGLLC